MSSKVGRAGFRPEQNHGLSCAVHSCVTKLNLYRM